MPSQYPSVNTNENIPLVYTEGIMVGKERMKKKKYNDVSFLQTELSTDLNLLIKFVKKSVYNI